MNLTKNIIRTLALVAVYNLAGFWIAKALISLSLATTVHTDFGVKYTTIYGHALFIFAATVIASLHGWRDDE